MSLTLLISLPFIYDPADRDGRQLRELSGRVGHRIGAKRARWQGDLGARLIWIAKTFMDPELNRALCEELYSSKWSQDVGDPELDWYWPEAEGRQRGIPKERWHHLPWLAEPIPPPGYRIPGQAFLPVVIPWIRDGSVTVHEAFDMLSDLAWMSANWGLNATSVSVDQVRELHEVYKVQKKNLIASLPIKELPAMPGPVVARWGDGWTVQMPTTMEQLRQEGESMRHCLGGNRDQHGNSPGGGQYWQWSRDGEGIAFSVRDPDGIPRVTIWFTGDGTPPMGTVEDVYGENDDKLRDLTERQAAKALGWIVGALGFDDPDRYSDDASASIGISNTVNYTVSGFHDDALDGDLAQSVRMRISSLDHARTDRDRAHGELYDLEEEKIPQLESDIEEYEDAIEEYLESIDEIRKTLEEELDDRMRSELEAMIKAHEDSMEDTKGELEADTTELNSMREDVDGLQEKYDESEADVESIDDQIWEGMQKLEVMVRDLLQGVPYSLSSDSFARFEVMSVNTKWSDDRDGEDHEVEGSATYSDGLVNLSLSVGMCIGVGAVNMSASIELTAGGTTTTAESYSSVEAAFDQIFEGPVNVNDKRGGIPDEPRDIPGEAMSLQQIKTFVRNAESRGWLPWGPTPLQIPVAATR